MDNAPGLDMLPDKEDVQDRSFQASNSLTFEVDISTDNRIKKSHSCIFTEDQKSSVSRLLWYVDRHSAFLGKQLLHSVLVDLLRLQRVPGPYTLDGLRLVCLLLPFVFLGDNHL